MSGCNYFNLETRRKQSLYYFLTNRSWKVGNLLASKPVTEILDSIYVFLTYSFAELQIDLKNPLSKMSQLILKPLLLLYNKDVKDNGISIIPEHAARASDWSRLSLRKSGVVSLPY